MKKCFLIAAALLLALPLAAQRGNIETDMFGDLNYRSGSYTAALKKDIFNSLTFSDSRGNNIVYEEKYLQKESPEVLSDVGARTEFFRFLVRKHRADSDYRAKYAVDIFDAIVFEDNRGNKVEAGTDIFGHPTYNERSGGVETSVTRSLDGTLEYRSGGESASLGKDVFGKWSYQDSSGNRFEFSPVAWNRLIRRFGSDENVLWFLIDEYLRD